MSWKSVQGKFVQALQVGKSHWLTVSNKQCPPGTICVYDSTKGAITADTNNQVAAVMHYKEVEIVLEVRSVVVIAAFMQRTNFVLAMTHMGTRSTSLTPLEIPRERSNQTISERDRDLVALLGLQLETLFCNCCMPEGWSANMARWYGSYHKTCINNPKTAFSRKREPWACETVNRLTVVCKNL